MDKKKARFSRNNIKNIYLLLFFGAFALSCSVGASYARAVGSLISSDGVAKLFSPSFQNTLAGYLKLFSRMFYDDAFDILYLFIAGFMLWGRVASLGLIMLRGAEFGYYVSMLVNTYAYDSSLFTLSEFFIFFAVNLSVNIFTIYFAHESFRFSIKAKEFYPRRTDVLKTRAFVVYLFNMIIVCGITALCRIAYTLINILI